MPSLRNKILSAYGYSKLAMLAFAIVVFFDLHYLNRQIETGQVVTDFREVTLEMRRIEKNLFLYRDATSYEQLMAHVGTAENAFAKGRTAFQTIIGTAGLRRIESLLTRYRAALDRYPVATPDAQANARRVIRDLGHELAAASSELSRGERQLLAQATRRAALLLLSAFVIVVLMGLAGGLFLVRRVVRPLRELEAGLRAIDLGQARVLPLPSKDQEIQSFVASFNAMLKHMRQQQDQARRNEKAAALGVLVSGVAHELNNPLSNISTSAQLMLEEGDSGDVELKKLWLTQIDSETERARRIVRRLLDSVRQPKLHRHRMPLSDLVQSSLELVNRQLPRDVQVCVGDAASIEIEVDRERLHQVFINLIKNAADAGAHHITVAAQLRTWDADAAEAGLLVGDPAMVIDSNEAICITIEDDGPGIPEALREHIFDPFITTRTGGEGTGLGLYLVEEIVSEHRGCIVLESAAGRGTRFSIWLPQS